MTSCSHSERCRVCGAPLDLTFADLGMIPLCQTYISRDRLFDGEMFYPLRATACLQCFYVGVPQYVAIEEIFSEYAYFSSTSASWCEYVRKSAAELITAFDLSDESQVVEMASNDGYMLQHFVAQGIPVVGVEPAANVAQVANDRGIPTIAKFFNLATAGELVTARRTADLLLAYNCLDHAPNVNDVVAGMKLVLKPEGVVQVEVPYLGSMVERVQFDTMYHDRFSYFSLLALNHIFEREELRVFDVAAIPTHGGSLRIRACHDGARSHPTETSVAHFLADERAAGVANASYYETFMEKTRAAKFAILERLIELRRGGASIVGYGVPAKGNVLLNYCGIRRDLLDYLVDRSPYKYGKFAPGSRLEIREVDQIRLTRPDFVLILPWNIKEEIMEQMSFIRDWGGRFIIPIPCVEVA